MDRSIAVVLLSSKGQLVIPAALRRKLGLRSGQRLAVRSGPGRRLVLAPVEDEASEIDAQLRRARAWSRRARRDLVGELHDRRKRERERERSRT
jgi:AbrB family looped-hinge helix DNA binding protein